MSVQIGQSTEDVIEQQEERYDAALPGIYNLRGRNTTFFRALVDEVTEYSRRYAEKGRVLDYLEPHEDCEYGALLVLPDETLVFVGEDPTAKTNANFGFLIEPSDPIAPPRTAEEALDLLKPTGVKQAIHADDSIPTRQGEWWLLETDEEPASSVFKPGVSSRPFGGSPLENHVPREYAIGVSDETFMQRLQDKYPELHEIVDGTHEAFHKSSRAHEIASIPDVELETPVPEVEELRELAEPVFVRGTLRHRENDHYMENIGDQWHKARTHSMDVYTIDSVGSGAMVRYD